MNKYVLFFLKPQAIISRKQDIILFPKDTVFFFGY